jgi:hypothetical protein
MNVRPAFVKVPLDAVSTLREDYLDGLQEGQEALVEVLVANAEPYRIEIKSRSAGYLLLHPNGTLLEYHLCLEFLSYAHQLLGPFLAEHPVQRALVKSYDATFLACAMDHQIAVRSRGILVRDYVRRELPNIASIRYARRLALEADLPRIRAVDQPVFTDPERLLAVIRAGAMQLFEFDGDLIGFGVMRPIIRGRPHMDVGVAVDRRFRNRGHALYMLRDLIDHCVAAGWKPVAGCSRENEASVRMGQRVGLLSRHRLLELSFR